VYVGAFGTPIIQHPSVASVIVDVPSGRPSCYCLPGVPEGTWFVHAVGVAAGVVPVLWARRTSLVGRHDSVTVTADSVTSAAVRLRCVLLTDPPILLALPDLEPPSDLGAAAGCSAITPRSAPVQPAA
jgi:hypothetical protein